MNIKVKLHLTFENEYTDLGDIRIEEFRKQISKKQTHNI